MTRKRRRQHKLLQAVIDAYRWGEGFFAGKTLNEAELAVLKRLFDSELAVSAVASMTDDPVVIWRIVGICLDTELHCRTFYEAVTTEQQMPERLEALSQAVTDLWGFLKELAAGPSNRLAAYVALEPGEFEYLGVALGEFRKLIDGRRRVAAQTPPRLGATNKLEGGDETAAIGWLAEGIKAVTGRPHYEQVAQLAEVVLRAKGITKARVRAALGTRAERDWRQQ